jgi:putative NADPH-quinone reductase
LDRFAASFIPAGWRFAMTMKRILLIDGHPDLDERHFVHGLVKAYADGAREAGHELRTIRLADLDIPLLTWPLHWEQGDVPASLQSAQDSIGWAEHLVFIYPLWLGDMPALLKGFLEQVMRPGFAFHTQPSGLPKKGLKGRSARIVVTMGMPAFLYRGFFRAHSVKSFKRNILKFVGIKPVRCSIIGGIDKDNAKSERYLGEMLALGRKAR